MRPFRTLIVWQKAHQLTLDVYSATETFPTAERFGLTSQTRRAAASVAANIVEGSVHDEGRAFAHALAIALGSAAELEYHLLLSRDLGYLPGESYIALDDPLAEVTRLLVTFRRRLLSDAPATTTRARSVARPADSRLASDQGQTLTANSYQLSAGHQP